jgi:hypothetical protein
MQIFRFSLRKSKLLIFATVIVTSVLLRLFDSHVLPEIVICLLFSVLLYLTRYSWLSAQNAKKIQSSLLLLAIGFVMSYKGWSAQWRDFLSPFIKKYLPNLPTLPQGISPFTLILILYAIIFVSYLLRDKTVMQIHKESLRKEFPQPDFKAKLLQYKKILANELNNIDIETNWNDYYFTPLDAEVEIISSNKKKRKVTDLLRAIKSDRESQAFLVIGDPGSGKSTALRKLAKELLNEVETTGKLPVYLNLREWQSKNRWSQENPPTMEDLMHFALTNLKTRGDTFSNEFLDEYFKPLFLGGRFFFLLDSFDEIPDILDASESSWLLDQYSDILYKFLAGAHSSRGVLASRIFRKPTKKFKAKITLEIRPFSELRIEENFKKSMGALKEDLIVEFFKKRLDLIPIARNPFSSALIVRYLKENDHAFPANQAVLYSSYIKKRLSLCQDLIEERGLSSKEIINYCIQIAFYLFSSKTLGLEVSIEELKDRIPLLPVGRVQDILDILTYSKIARTGRNNKQFSFGHRRFNEYFVVQHLLKGIRIEGYLEDIPTDSRWRDALILYCEVAEEEQAVAIAIFCWSNIQCLAEDTVPKDYLRVIHSLRFLSDAFKTRLNCILSFSNDLSKIIKDRISADSNMLLTKFSVEAAGLLNENDLQIAIIKAFKTNNWWIYEIALKSCRHLPAINEVLRRRIVRYINSMKVKAIIGNRKDLLFSVSLSDGFKMIRKYLLLRIWDYILFLVGLVLLILTRPIAALILWASFFSTVGLNNFNKYQGSDMYERFTYGRLLVIYRLIIAFSFLFAVMHLDRTSLYVTLSSYFLPNSFGKSQAFESFKYFNENTMMWSLFHYSVLNAIIGILIFPYLDIANSFSIVMRKWKRTMLSLIGVILTILFIAVAFSIAARFRIFEKVLLFGLPSIGLIVTVFVLYEITCDYWQLSLIKRQIVHESILKRSKISEFFNKFNTSVGRYSFVKLLSNYSIEAAGEWPDGILPNKGNDYGSIMLAQLEEKWLGLN